MKEADNSHRNEGDGRSRGFGVRPPGSPCRHKSVKSFLEEPFAVTGAGGLSGASMELPTVGGALAPFAPPLVQCALRAETKLNDRVPICQLLSLVDLHIILYIL
jgi:hypothetical protein